MRKYNYIKLLVCIAMLIIVSLCFTACADSFAQVRQSATAKASTKTQSSTVVLTKKDKALNKKLAEKKYKGKGYIKVKKNKPQFSKAQLKRARNAYQSYGKLDKYGRCTTAMCSLSVETMPGRNEERGDISSVHPTGWMSNQGWERCHLVAWSLSAQNANEKNLVTGSRQLNVTGGMYIFEKETAQYINRTGNHVLYRVTPIFKGKEMVPRGVHMEARSVEDKGLSYNVYIFNVMEGYKINYKTGKVSGKPAGKTKVSSKGRTYVLNINTRKFHYPSCSSAKRTSAKNKKTVTESRSKLIKQGYDPCGQCEP